MAEERTWWETIKGESGELVEKVKGLIHEGNVRRIVIRQGDRSIAEFPLTVGVVGTLWAPILASVGAIVALVTNCSIAVQREAVSTPSPTPAEPPSPPSEAPLAEATPSEPAPSEPTSSDLAPSEPVSPTEPPSVS